MEEVRTAWDVRVLLIPDLERTMAPLAEVPLPATSKKKKTRHTRRPMWLQVLVCVLGVSFVAAIRAQSGPVQPSPCSAAVGYLVSPAMTPSSGLRCVRCHTLEAVGSLDVDLRIHYALFGLQISVVEAKIDDDPDAEMLGALWTWAPPGLKLQGGKAKWGSRWFICGCKCLCR